MEYYSYLYTVNEKSRRAGHSQDVGRVDSNLPYIFILYDDKKKRA